MGTHAEWILWVGITQENYLLKELSEKAEAFIQEVTDSWESIQRNGLVIQSVGMHGETIGLGVVIKEVNWETEIGEQNVFDLAIVTQAQEAQAVLNQVFDEVEIPFRSVIYNHIDLGG